MKGIYEVTFKGDHFVFTIKVRATNDMIAVPIAIGEVASRYDFDLAGHYNDAEVVSLRDEDAPTCYVCKQDFAVRNGTMCSDCFRHATSDFLNDLT